MNKIAKIVAIVIVIVVLAIIAIVSVVQSGAKESSTNEVKTVQEENKTSDDNKVIEDNGVIFESRNMIDENIQGDNTIGETEKEIVLPKYEESTYGTSENGRELKYYSLAPEKYNDTFIFVFAIHGYEDAYDKDGQVLVDTAKYLVNQYKTSDVSLLNDNRLIIIECANPDGLYDGNSNDGFGRCNAKGIDLNRDFDVIYKPFTNSRNYTPKAFSGKESKALSKFIKKEKPKVVIDFHGWEDGVIGDTDLAKIFKENMSLKHKTEFNENCNGFLSYWAHEQGATSVLVEFKNDNISRTDLKMAVDEILELF